MDGNLTASNLTTTGSDPSIKDGAPAISPIASLALLHLPTTGEGGGCGDGGGGGGEVHGSDVALPPVDLRAAAGLEEGGGVDGRRSDGRKRSKGWLAFLWSEEGEEEKEAMEEDEERSSHSSERRKLASTSIVASLSVPWVGLVYVSNRCPASTASSLSAPPAAQKGGGGTLDVAGTGITVLFRQMKVDGPAGSDDCQGQMGCSVEPHAHLADNGGGAGGKIGVGQGTVESSSGSARDREREREKEKERERLMVRDVRACVVGLSAHVHPVGADAETVLSFGGLVSSVCGKRRMELSRGNLANVVPDGKGSAGGAGGEGIWAGMPEPRGFTGALSLFEHVRMVRNNSKSWLSRSDQTYEPMSEEMRGNAVERVFTSPLPYACGGGAEKGTAVQAQQGGLLMDALMARDADTVVASLLRRAQGEQVPLAVPEQPKFDDGWAHDDSVAILFSLSMQQHAPTSDRERVEKNDKFSQPAGAGRSGHRECGCTAEGDQGREGTGDVKKQDEVWIKTHVQPLRVRMSNSAMQCCHDLLASAVHAKRPTPAPRFSTPKQAPASAPSSSVSPARSYPPGPVPASQAARVARQNSARERPRLLVSLDLMLAGRTRCLCARACVCSSVFGFFVAACLGISAADRSAPSAPQKRADAPNPTGQSLNPRWPNTRCGLGLLCRGGAADARRLAGCAAMSRQTFSRVGAELSWYNVCWRALTERSLWQIRIYWTRCCARGQWAAQAAGRGGGGGAQAQVLEGQVVRWARRSLVLFYPWACVVFGTAWHRIRDASATLRRRGQGWAEMGGKRAFRGCMVRMGWGMALVKVEGEGKQVVEGQMDTPSWVRWGESTGGRCRLCSCS
jgi:hypothetical protein